MFQQSGLRDTIDGFTHVFENLLCGCSSALDDCPPTTNPKMPKIVFLTEIGRQWYVPRMCALKSCGLTPSPRPSLAQIRRQQIPSLPLEMWLEILYQIPVTEMAFGFNTFEHEN